MSAVSGRSSVIGPRLRRSVGRSGSPRPPGEQPDVELVADRGDVAALLGAEDVAGAADLHVAHGEPQPAPSSVASWIASSRSCASAERALSGL